MHTEAGSWNIKARQIFYFTKQKKILLRGAVEIQNQSLKITAEETKVIRKLIKAETKMCLSKEGFFFVL